MIIGELALGSIRDRTEVLRLLSDLPAVVSARNAECLPLVEARGLHGRGFSLMDAHLLASARLTPESLVWTRDGNLAAAASDKSLAWGGS